LLFTSELLFKTVHASDAGSFDLVASGKNSTGVVAVYFP